jgi:hypothetical protein
LLGGAMPQKRALSRTFLVQTPHSTSHACRRRPCGPTPTAEPCGSFCSLRSQRSRHARTFRPCGAQAPHYRSRQSASSTPTRSSLRSLCGPAISRTLWPGRWAACGGLSANIFRRVSFSGEYPRRMSCYVAPPQRRQRPDQKETLLYSAPTSPPASARWPLLRPA